MLAKAGPISIQHSQSTAPTPPAPLPPLPFHHVHFPMAAIPPSPLLQFIPSPHPLLPPPPTYVRSAAVWGLTAAVQVRKLTLNSCFQLLKRLCRVCSSVSGSIPAAAVSCSFTSRMNARSSSNRPLLRSNSSYTSHHIDCLLPQALTTSEVVQKHVCAVLVMLDVV